MSKHSDTNCQVPFCKVCWVAIKANIVAVKGVADTLLTTNPNNSERKEG